MTSKNNDSDIDSEVDDFLIGVLQGRHMRRLYGDNLRMVVLREEQVPPTPPAAPPSCEANTAVVPPPREKEEEGNGVYVSVAEAIEKAAGCDIPVTVDGTHNHANPCRAPIVDAYAPSSSPALPRISIDHAKVEGSVLWQLQSRHLAKNIMWSQRCNERATRLYQELLGQMRASMEQMERQAATEEDIGKALGIPGKANLRQGGLFGIVGVDRCLAISYAWDKAADNIPVRRRIVGHAYLDGFGVMFYPEGSELDTSNGIRIYFTIL